MPETLSLKVEICLVMSGVFIFLYRSPQCLSSPIRSSLAWSLTVRLAYRCDPRLPVFPSCNALFRSDHHSSPGSLVHTTLLHFRLTGLDSLTVQVLYLLIFRPLRGSCPSVPYVKIIAEQHQVLKCLCQTEIKLRSLLRRICLFTELLKTIVSVAAETLSQLIIAATWECKV